MTKTASSSMKPTKKAPKATHRGQKTTGTKEKAPKTLKGPPAVNGSMLVGDNKGKAGKGNRRGRRSA